MYGIVKVAAKVTYRTSKLAESGEGVSKLAENRKHEHTPGSCLLCIPIDRLRTALTNSRATVGGTSVARTAFPRAFGNLIMASNDVAS
jgi:hypothetical protein